MNRILNLSLTFSFYICSTLAFATEIESNQTQASIAEIIQSKKQIIAYFDDEFNPIETPATKGGYYRKVLGQTATGWYVIQDYYQQSHKKQTDPFIIKDPKELKEADPKSIEGELIFWHQNGKKAIVTNYIDDQRNGTWTWWRVNGQIEEEANYKNDQLDGTNTVWYANGKQKSVETYKDGKRDGPSTFWHLNGTIEADTLYKNDVPVEVVEAQPTPSESRPKKQK